MAADTESTLSTDAQTLITGFLRVADVAVGVIAALLAYWLRNDTLAMPYYYQLAVALGAILSLNFLTLAGAYRQPFGASMTLQLARASGAFAGVLLTLLGLAYFAGTLEWFSRPWVGLWFFMTITGFTVVRLGALLQRRRWQEDGELAANVAVVGARDLGRAVIRQLRASERSGVRIIGVFEDHATGTREIEGVPVRGTVDDLIRLARRERVDEIVLAMVDRSEDEIESVLSRLRTVPANTKLCAHTLRFNIPVRGFSAFAGLPLLHVYERPLRGWGGFWKALEDRALGAVILALTLPLLLLIAALVRIDSPGPALFRQKRSGFNNNEFTVFKFRTMHHDPVPDPTVPQARRNDPRVTRIGAFLRRSSLDELPQIINVLRGDMSLVGPRPHAVAHNEQYAEVIDGYLGRHRVKPGITGWAQVNGYRGETNTPEKMRLRVEHDLYYIDNWSLAFDLKILILTLFTGFINRNAY